MASAHEGSSDANRMKASSVLSGKEASETDMNMDPALQLDPTAFQMGRILGTGSFATVFLAQHRPTKRYLVIKRLDRVPRDQQEAVQNEVAVMMSGRGHPNVVSLKGWFRDSQGQLCLVMEYCEGGTLAAVLKGKGLGAASDEGYFSEDVVMAWLVQLLMALAHLHSRRIIHRDLKPANIFLSRDQAIIKLGDLGIAKQLESSTELAVTMLGTPYYMSPEIVAGRPYTYGSDIWSLGCVLYEMAARQMPFDAHGLPQLMVKILRNAYKPLPSHFSRPFQQLLNAMLRADPDDRPSTNDLLLLPIVRKHLQMLIGGSEPVDGVLPPVSLTEASQAIRRRLRGPPRASSKLALQRADRVESASSKTGGSTRATSAHPNRRPAARLAAAGNRNTGQEAAASGEKQPLRPAPDAAAARGDKPSGGRLAANPAAKVAQAVQAPVPGGVVARPSSAKASPKAGAVPATATAAVGARRPSAAGGSGSATPKSGGSVTGRRPAAKRPDMLGTASLPKVHRTKSIKGWESGAEYERKQQQLAEKRFQARELEQRLAREQVRLKRKEADPVARAKEAERDRLAEELFARKYESRQDDGDAAFNAMFDAIEEEQVPGADGYEDDFDEYVDDGEAMEVGSDEELQDAGPEETRSSGELADMSGLSRSADTVPSPKSAWEVEPEAETEGAVQLHGDEMASIMEQLEAGGVSGDALLGASGTAMLGTAPLDAAQTFHSITPPPRQPSPAVARSTGGPRVSWADENPTHTDAGPATSTLQATSTQADPRSPHQTSTSALYQDPALSSFGTLTSPSSSRTWDVFPTRSPRLHGGSSGRAPQSPSPGPGSATPRLLPPLPAQPSPRAVPSFPSTVRMVRSVSPRAMQRHYNQADIEAGHAGRRRRTHYSDDEQVMDRGRDLHGSRRQTRHSDSSIDASRGGPPPLLPVLPRHRRGFPPDPSLAAVGSCLLGPPRPPTSGPQGTELPLLAPGHGSSRGSSRCASPARSSVGAAGSGPLLPSLGKAGMDGLEAHVRPVHDGLEALIRPVHDGLEAHVRPGGGARGGDGRGVLTGKGGRDAGADASPGPDEEDGGSQCGDGEEENLEDLEDGDVTTGQDESTEVEEVADEDEEAVAVARACQDALIHSFNSSGAHSAEVLAGMAAVAEGLQLQLPAWDDAGQHHRPSSTEGQADGLPALPSPSVVASRHELHRSAAARAVSVRQVADLEAQLAAAWAADDQHAAREVVEQIWQLTLEDGGDEVLPDPAQRVTSILGESMVQVQVLQKPAPPGSRSTTASSQQEPVAAGTGDRTGAPSPGPHGPPATSPPQGRPRSHTGSRDTSSAAAAAAAYSIMQDREGEQQAGGAAAEGPQIDRKDGSTPAASGSGRPRTAHSTPVPPHPQQQQRPRSAAPTSRNPPQSPVDSRSPDRSSPSPCRRLEPSGAPLDPGDPQMGPTSRKPLQSPVDSRSPDRSSASPCRLPDPPGPPLDPVGPQMCTTSGCAEDGGASALVGPAHDDPRTQHSVMRSSCAAVTACDRGESKAGSGVGTRTTPRREGAAGGQGYNPSGGAAPRAQPGAEDSARSSQHAGPAAPGSAPGGEASASSGQHGSVAPGAQPGGEASAGSDQMLAALIRHVDEIKKWKTAMGQSQTSRKKTLQQLVQSMQTEEAEVPAKQPRTGAGAPDQKP